MSRKPRKHDLKLDLKDRWMLWCLYRIMSFVDPHEAAEYATMMDALQNGYHWHYGHPCWLFRGDDECLATEDAHDLRRTLHLYRCINRSLEDSAGVEPVLNSAFARFRGVDRATEPALLEYLEFLRSNPKDHLSDLLPDDLDSGIPNTLAIYRRMLRAWDALGGAHRLTGSQIARIMAAAPDVTPRPRRGEDGEAGWPGVLHTRT
jgi:uncharacterized protein YfbU (UPF0304 family)